MQYATVRVHRCTARHEHRGCVAATQHSAVPSCHFTACHPKESNLEKKTSVSTSVGPVGLGCEDPDTAPSNKVLTHISSTV